MKILLYENPDLVSAKELEEDLLKIPNWRKEKALRYRFLMDRVLCVKAYLLLKQGLYEEYAITEDVKFICNPNGKPFLENYSNIFFNLSHCKRGVLCAISEQPIGCDIEEIPDGIDMDLLKQSMNALEIQSITNATNPCALFAKYWTMKEALTKYYGDGLKNDLPDLLTKDAMASVSFETVINLEQSYVYTVCRAKE